MSFQTYDPLDVLTRAQKNSDEWWNSTLDHARKRTELDQSMEDNAYRNDKRAMTYGSDLFKTNAENMFQGTRAETDTALEPDRLETQKLVYGRDGLRAKDQSWQLENAMSPENRAARAVVYSNNFQSPAAMLTANAATAGMLDLAERNKKAAEISQQYPGALGAYSQFANQGAQAESLGLAGDISSGNLDRANKTLELRGLGVKVEPGSIPNTFRFRHDDGTVTANMDGNAASNYLNDRTGSKPGQLQTAFDNEVRYNRAQQAADRRLDEARRDDELRSLQVQYQVVAKDLGANSPDAMKLADRMNKLTAMRYSNGVQPQASGAYRPPATSAGAIIGTENPLGVNGTDSWDNEGQSAGQPSGQVANPWPGMDIERIDSGLRERVLAANAAWKAVTGKDLPVNSGARTPEKQQQLIDDAKAGKPGVFTPAPVVPGKEVYHTNAVDIDCNVPDEFLKRFGLHRPLAEKGDRPHVMAMPGADPIAPAVYSPPTPQHPTAAPTAQASTTYVPPSSQVKSVWNAERPMNDDVMKNLEESRTKAVDAFLEVKRDWERVNSPRYRGTISETQRANIKRELDAARAAFHRQHDEYVTGKREWLRIKGNEAYSPYQSVAEKRDELITQRMDRYK